MICKECRILADPGKEGRLAFREPRQADEVRLGTCVIARRWIGCEAWRVPAPEKTGSRTQLKLYRKPLAQITEAIPAALRSSSRIGPETSFRGA
jgi:hypothetical protein